MPNAKLTYWHPFDFIDIRNRLKKRNVLHEYENKAQALFNNA
jgi:hypothetical protein